VLAPRAKQQTNLKQICAEFVCEREDARISLPHVEKPIYTRGILTDVCASICNSLSGDSISQDFCA
jgi:hypothetical protein